MKLRRKLWLALLVAGLLAAGCGDTGDTSDDPLDDPVLADLDELMDGVPAKADLVDEKTDTTPPKAFDLLGVQSPVKSQGRRGVCSIFAASALMESLYRIEGTYPDLDFSEQYMQWVVKAKIGAFPKSSGSNVSYNLQAASRHGIVEERYWIYEVDQWNFSNDPACDGTENQPVRCYTNGEPPQGAVDAFKWKLPSSGRYISATPTSIKAAINNKQVPLTIEGPFYYQAWGHGGSTLPTNRTYWRKGYVVTPNAKDIEESNKHRAGHGILVVGWDDDLEVQQLDAGGNPAKDASGKPIMDKGFFLIKNSWGTGSFGIENSKQKGYGWISYSYVQKYLSARLASLPDIEPPPEACGDTLDNDRDGKTDCEDSDCAQKPQCTGEENTYENTPLAAIPDNSATGLSSTLNVTKDCTLASVTVAVDITHTYAGDVELRLLHPDGTDLQIQNATSESSKDLKKTYVVEDWKGKSSKGLWTLKAIDHAASDTGTLNRWSVTLTCQEKPPYQNTTAAAIPDNSPAGVTSTINVPDHGEVLGLTLQVSLTHGKTGDLEIRLVHPDQSMATVLAASGQAGTDLNQTFIVTDWNAQKKDAAGTWTLVVADKAAENTGTLNSWGMTIQIGDPIPTGADNLFFSEYVEGSSYNKLLEIYNAGSSAYDLAKCKVIQYTNGSTSGTVIQLNGTLAGKGVFTVCSSQFGGAASLCNQKAAGLTFTGDDALELFCDGETQDVFGKVGERTTWAQDKTLRRKCTVTQGDRDKADAFDPNAEYDSFAKDAFDGLGKHCG